METTLQVVRNLSNVRHVNILISLIIVFWELKVNFLSEEKLQEKVHKLAVLFLLEIVVSEHSNTAADYQFTSTFLMLIN